MHNRNEVKWNPFNSLINGTKIIKELNNEHQKISKPILSEDQLNEISQKLIEALTTKSLINIKYYENGEFHNLKGIINYFNKQKNSITINYNTIYLTQIIDITEITY